MKYLLPLIMILAGCATTIDKRGYYGDLKGLEAIPVGTCKQEILQRFGSPSAQGMFNGDIWYYISRTTASQSFFDPKLTQQKIIKIVFVGDIVRSVTCSDKSQNCKVKAISETTPVEGYESSFFREIFSNLGRFKDEKKDANAGISKD